MAEPYNGKYDQLDETFQKELLRIFEGYSLYYRSIGIDTNSKLINWLFTLNAGSLAGLLAFIGAGKDLLGQYPLIIGLIMILFGTEIISIYLSIFFEKLKFNKKGLHLDTEYDRLQKYEITGKEFLHNINSYYPNEYKYENPNVYEKLSLFFWIIGFLLGVGLLFYISTPLYQIEKNSNPINPHTINPKVKL